MNELKLTSIEGQAVVDSREVAKMTGKRHGDLMRSIESYDTILTDAELRSLNFFIPSTYKDTKGETRKCFFLTKKGCDMVANKMTGSKGVLFTAEYVTKFEEMEKELAAKSTPSYMIEDPKKRALRWIEEQEEVEEHKRLSQYALDILKTPSLVTVTQIAKDYGMSAIRFNALLKENKIQFKQSGQWMLYSKYSNEGYTHSATQTYIHKDGSEDVRMQTKWTQKGRLFLYEFLKKKGIVPMIERQKMRLAK